MKVADFFATLRLKPDKASFSAADRLLGTVRTAMLGLVAFGTVRVFTGMVKDVALAADEVAKMSQTLGIGVEALQQLEFAAQISGTTLQSLRKGLGRLSRVASDAADRGLKTAQDALDGVGLKAKDAEGNMRPLEDMLGDIADKFSGMEDGAKKAALAQELFGRAGVDLIPLLNEGRDGIDALRKEFVDLGAQIDGDTAKAFEQLNDDQLRVQTAIKGIKTQATIALLPVLKDITKDMLAWIKANKDLLRQKLEKVFRAIGVAIRVLAKAISIGIDFISRIVEIFQDFQGHLGLTLGLIIAFSATLRAKAIQMAASWVIAFAPIILTTAAFAALFLLVEDFWGLMTGKDSLIADALDPETVEKIKIAWESLTESAAEFWDIVKEIMNRITGGKFALTQDATNIAIREAREAGLSSAEIARRGIAGPAAQGAQGLKDLGVSEKTRQGLTALRTQAPDDAGFNQFKVGDPSLTNLLRIARADDKQVPLFNGGIRNEIKVNIDKASATKEEIESSVFRGVKEAMDTLNRQ